jgi:para-nitrobenzyl esterase
VIASVLGVSAARASAVAAVYPVGAYLDPVVALSTLVSDANFACPALQVDGWTSHSARTFAYEFDDGTAPPLFTGSPFYPIATHSSEIQYLFDQPNAPHPATLDATQEALAQTMRTAWAKFAATGSPSTNAVPWPSIKAGGSVLTLLSPHPQVTTSFAATHHCSFWAAG